MVCIVFWYACADWVFVFLPCSEGVGQVQSAYLTVHQYDECDNFSAAMIKDLVVFPEDFRFLEGNSMDL